MGDSKTISTAASKANKEFPGAVSTLRDQLSTTNAKIASLEELAGIYITYLKTTKEQLGSLEKEIEQLKQASIVRQEKLKLELVTKTANVKSLTEQFTVRKSEQTRVSTLLSDLLRTANDGTNNIDTSVDAAILSLNKLEKIQQDLRAYALSIPKINT